MPVQSMIRTARHAATVARRRGIGYFGYLVGAVMWPRAAYRFGWGPSAPPILQGVFAAASELVAAKLDARELVDLALVAESGAATAVSDARPDEIEHLMERAHSAGITGVSRSFGKLLRTGEGALRFSDLTEARKHRLGSTPFVAGRNADRRAFNRMFGASLLTEETARESNETLKAKVPERYRDYAPMDFGCGSTLGEIASTDTGNGHWDFFNRQIVAPIVNGKRVLDLGSNNGSVPSMMLRAGAREVVAVEFTRDVAELARLNARISSWRDGRPYDIQVLTGDMRVFVTEDLGQFDVVTAFCSLYYLPDEDMARIIAKAASMSAVLMLQANEAIDNLPAKTLELHRLMRENGYAEIQVHTPAGFARALLVGYTQIGAAAPARRIERI